MKVYLVWIIPCIQLAGLVRCEDKRYEVDSNAPFWANRGRRGEEIGPFWANRGRRTDKRPPVQSDTNNEEDNEWNTRLEEPLFVEEPRWILVRRDDENRASSFVGPPFIPYFVTRGKRVKNYQQLLHNQYGYMRPILADDADSSRNKNMITTNTAKMNDIENKSTDTDNTGTDTDTDTSISIKTGTVQDDESTCDRRDVVDETQCNAICLNNARRPEPPIQGKGPVWPQRAGPGSWLVSKRRLSSWASATQTKRPNN